MELSGDDVKKLFAEGYYEVNCDVCDKPVGFIKVFSGYDYTYDETLCFDCALVKVKKMNDIEGSLYG